MLFPSIVSTPLRTIIYFLLLTMTSCLPHPGSLNKLPKTANLKKDDFFMTLPNSKGNTLSVQYLGCGGLYLFQDGAGIMIDPFFSNQKIGMLGRSVLSKGSAKRNIRSDKDMVKFGLQAIEEKTGPLADQVDAIFTAHSHYDHLMDVPAVFQYLHRKPIVYVSSSGYNICRNIIDTTRLQLLENNMTTIEKERSCIVIEGSHGNKINVYPILADHNPHIKHIKFFDGTVVRPLKYFTSAYEKTAANDWLEGKTFSFLIDYVNASNDIDLRIFVQSSSCNPDAGTPPRSVIGNRSVDIAFLGVASYEESPDYPERLLQAITPTKVVLIHWEDFFRKYNKAPKSVEATDVPGFYSLKCIKNLKDSLYTPWPRTRLKIQY